jgi:tRNA-2-methylthio-N6-dimethylallyladenosine synthase
LKLQEVITFKKNMEMEGQELEILIEGMSETDDKNLTGRTLTNKIVNFRGDPNDIGNIVMIKVKEARQHSLYGEKV